jgi:hypothetical protein
MKEYHRTIFTPLGSSSVLAVRLVPQLVITTQRNLSIFIIAGQTIIAFIIFSISSCSPGLLVAVLFGGLELHIF